MDVTPGWYPDPDDSTNLRWWDGSAWTDHRQPIGQGRAAEADPADSGASDPSAAAENADDSTPADSDAPEPESPDPTGIDTPAVDAEQGAVDPTVVDTPAVEPQPTHEQTVAGVAPPWAPAPPPAFEPAEPTAAIGEIPPPPAVTGDGYPAAPTPPPPAESGGSGKRKPLLIGLGVVAVLAIAAGAFLFFSGDDAAEYTWDGEDIADLEETLEVADDTFLAGVEERNGAVTNDSRCYMVQSADDDVDRKSDVFDFLRCGPVLFVDDDPSDGVWITYALSADENDDGELILTSAEAPQSNQPSHYDDDEESLSRPDGEDPPDGDGDIEPPDPPRAEAGLVLSGDPALDEIDLDNSFVRAVGLTKSLELVGVSEPNRYGSGDAARRPADGEQFFAFEIRTGPGDSYYGTPSEQTTASNTSSATISLDVDGEETVIARGDDPDYDYRHLVSVPADVATIDIVLEDSGVTQRISLRSQEPSPDNLEVLARTNRDVELGSSQAFPVIITHPDGFVQEDTFTVTIERAELLYYVNEVPDRLPSGPDRAFLVIHHFVTSDVTGITPEDDIGLEPGHMHLETDSGGVLSAINLAPNDGDILLAFEVSGGFSGATLSVRGAAASGDINIDLSEPDFRVPIEIDSF